MISIHTAQGFREYLRKNLEGRTVAVVGSGPNVIGSSHGERIDAHEIVVRFNDANCVGREADVGRRTDVRFVGFNINVKNKPFFAQLDDRTLLITKKVNISELALRADDVALSFSIHASCFPAIDKLLGSSFSSRSRMPPRTGLSFLTALLGSGADVSVFGMELTPRATGQLHYYSSDDGLFRELQRWEKYHCPLELELEALSLILEAAPEIKNVYA